MSQTLRRIGREMQGQQVPKAPVSLTIDVEYTKVYIPSVHKESSMAKEKVMTFVQARSKLSKIVDRVAEHGDTYVVSKRQKPVAVIIGIDRYRHLSGTNKYMKEVGGKRILNIEGIATAVGDIDDAIRTLRKSRLEAIRKSIP
jgi:prevent-host-death family protein